ncbi:MAG: septum formation initiator family protein [Clostridia bacterium]|jgi:cell division protein DivIC|nr:septum formation initiator family protein [Clostridia bacterium]
MKVNVNRLIKKLIMLACIIYFVITIYNQQKVLNEYKHSIAVVEKQIEEKTEYKDSLIDLKENSNSLEYIEKIAREKLQMYKPNEKVYKDK